jgi:hypothetical protein
MRIAAENYEELKRFFVWAADYFFQSKQPVAALNDTEASSRANARTGLAMAIGDIIELAEHHRSGEGY